MDASFEKAASLRRGYVVVDQRRKKFFASKSAEMKILLCKWHIGKKIFYKFFIIEKFDFLVEMPPEREVL